MPTPSTYRDLCWQRDAPWPSRGGGGAPSPSATSCARCIAAAVLCLAPCSAPTTMPTIATTSTLTWAGTVAMEPTRSASSPLPLQLAGSAISHTSGKQQAVVRARIATLLLLRALQVLTGLPGSASRCCTTRCQSCHAAGLRGACSIGVDVRRRSVHWPVGGAGTGPPRARPVLTADAVLLRSVGWRRPDSGRQVAEQRRWRRVAGIAR